MSDADSKIADDASDSTMLDVISDNVQDVVFHICSLLTRRSITIDGMVCTLMTDKTKCRLWLAVSGDGQFKQVTEELQTLEHVQSATSNKGGLWAVYFLLSGRR